jgi:hypothetical protein
MGKDAVGGLLLRPVGLLGGALGKKNPIIVAERVDLNMSTMDKEHL